jgi:hypothetical protein
MHARSLTFLAPVAMALFAVPAPGRSAPPPAASMAGTWDLVWQTRHGPDRQGYLVVTQEGTRIAAEIHGRGSVKAKGVVAGQDFTLRGSRLAVPYLISGRIEGNRLSGTLAILSVRRSFTGTRR